MHYVGLNAIASRWAEFHQQIRYFSRFIAFRSTNDTPRIYKRLSLRSKREPNTSERNRQRASVHGCFGGRSPCGGFFGSAYTMREGASFCMRRGARNTQEEERGYFCICVESRYLTLTLCNKITRLQVAVFCATLQILFYCHVLLSVHWILELGMRSPLAFWC